MGCGASTCRAEPGGSIQSDSWSGCLSPRTLRLTPGRSSSEARYGVAGMPVQQVRWQSKRDHWDERRMGRVQASHGLGAVSVHPHEDVHEIAIVEGSIRTHDLPLKPPGGLPKEGREQVTRPPPTEPKGRRDHWDESRIYVVNLRSTERAEYADPRPSAQVSRQASEGG